MKKSMYLPQTFAAACALLSTLFLANTTSAAIVTTAANGPSTSGGTFTISGSDLLQTSALVSATYSGTEAFGSLLAKFYDGVKYGPGGKNDTTDSFVPERFAANSFATFVLDTTANPDGYDLKSVVSVTGTGSGTARSAQAYDFAVKYVGGGSFTNLFSMTSGLTDNINAANTEVQVTTANSVFGGTIAKGVAEIKITFYPYNNDTSGAFEQVYRELDIVGSPTVVPEPGTTTLLSGGLLGFLAYTRRRRK